MAVWARRSFAADTNFMELVIFCVDSIEVMRVRISFRLPMTIRI